MIKIGLIHFKDYENWIKSLGYDREWFLQATQAEFYKNLVTECATIGAFSFPLTHDSYVVILNTVVSEELQKIVVKLRSKAPTEMLLYFGVGETYVDALKNLYETANECETEKTVVTHVDLNGYNGLINKKDFYYVKQIINEIFLVIEKISSSYGGLSYYAGGDNIITFIPFKYVSSFLEQIEKEIDNAKIGVGIAPKPREALKLAAKALELLRQRPLHRGIMVLED
ncbi:MAG: GTP cyclohydrolase IIa [Ignisphaera sp.]